MKIQQNILLCLVVAALAACTPPDVQPNNKGTIADTMPKSAKRGVAFSFTQVTDLPLLSP